MRYCEAHRHTQAIKTCNMVRRGHQAFSSSLHVMQFSLRSFALLASAAMVSLAGATPVDGDDTTDWKYGVGWDGTVLDPSAIGEVVGTVSNETSLAVSPLILRISTFV